MSNKILTLVWDHAPAMGVTATDLLVLLRLADSATEETGIGWESVPTIAAKIGSTDRTVQRCLRRLEAWAIVEDVPEEEWPAASRTYRSYPRRITPVDQWSVRGVEEGGDNLSGVTECHQSEAQTVTPVSPNPVLITSTSPRSSLDTSYPNSSTSVAARRSSKWASRRAQQEASTTDSDPSRLLDDDEPQPQPKRRPTAEELAEGQARVTEKRKRTRRLGPSEAAARFFESKAEAKGGLVPGTQNTAALASNIAGWFREGHTDAAVREMVRLYWSDAYAPRRASDKPAWQDFLAQRGRLFADAKRIAVEAEREEKADDVDYWTKGNEESAEVADKYNPANWT